MFLSAATLAPACAAELKVIDSTDAPWPSIGRVNVAGYRSTSMCTGTLVAPTLVLTAAHCLYNKTTLKPFPVDDLIFVAGVRREEYSARLEPACFFTSKDYVPRLKPKLGNVHDDVGLIVLKEPSSLPPVPTLTLEDAAILTKDTRFQSAGYRRSRRFLPTVVEDCKVMGTTEDAWVTDCASEAGASGGPLLVETPNGLRVAGVMSAKIDNIRSAIVPFFEWQDLLGNPRCSGTDAVAASALRLSTETSD
jgi:protease YdgD